MDELSSNNPSTFSELVYIQRPIVLATGSNAEMKESTLNNVRNNNVHDCDGKPPGRSTSLPNQVSPEQSFDCTEVKLDKEHHSTTSITTNLQQSWKPHNSFLLEHDNSEELIEGNDETVSDIIQPQQDENANENIENTTDAVVLLSPISIPNRSSPFPLSNGYDNDSNLDGFNHTPIITIDNESNQSVTEEIIENNHDGSMVDSQELIMNALSNQIETISNLLVEAFSELNQFEDDDEAQETDESNSDVISEDSNEYSTLTSTSNSSSQDEINTEGDEQSSESDDVESGIPNTISQTSNGSELGCSENETPITRPLSLEWIFPQNLGTKGYERFADNRRPRPPPGHKFVYSTFGTEIREASEINCPTLPWIPSNADKIESVLKQYLIEYGPDFRNPTKSTQVQTEITLQVPIPEVNANVVQIPSLEEISLEGIYKKHIRKSLKKFNHCSQSHSWPRLWKISEVDNALSRSSINCRRSVPIAIVKPQTKDENNNDCNEDTKTKIHAKRRVIAFVKWLFCCKSLKPTENKLN